MTFEQWIIFFFAIQLTHGFSTWKLYKKAGQSAWKAFVPIYNAVVLMRIINRPIWWVFLLFLPVVNLIMFVVVWVETARSFGKNTKADTFWAVISLGFYSFYLNYFEPVKYVENRSVKPKSASGDWVSSILFAIVAATIVHTYFIQPYVIPTSSLEKTLLVGDFLFVSKMHYGARTPITTVAAPMFHDTLPIVKLKSYSTFPELPYFRFPSFQKIKRNDIVVFNWPVDTLFNMYLKADKKYYKPIDKKTNYVKRCVGIPGDTLEVRDGYVYINGKQNQLPDRAKLQFSYEVLLKDGRGFDNSIYQMLKDRYDISDGIYRLNNGKIIIPAATEESVELFKKHPSVKTLVKNTQELDDRDFGIFPRHPKYRWNNDQFGPLYIPQAGKTIDLNKDMLPLYKRVLTEYEGRMLQVKGDTIYIDGKQSDTYTFKQDYYWMMGDNRHNSQDSRAWGFVPFDHVVGKPIFVWFSWGNGKPRFERVFTTVGGSGEPQSYFIHTLVLALFFYGFNTYRRKKKTQKSGQI